MSYRKFYRYFQNNKVYRVGDISLGERIYKYSDKQDCNLLYSNFRNQYTILNLPTLSTQKEFIKLNAYLDYNNNTTNIVKVKELYPKYLKVYNKLFFKPNNYLFKT